MLEDWCVLRCIWYRYIYSIILFDVMILNFVFFNTYVQTLEKWLINQEKLNLVSPILNI